METSGRKYGYGCGGGCDPLGRSHIRHTEVIHHTLLLNDIHPLLIITLISPVPPGMQYPALTTADNIQLSAADVYSFQESYAVFMMRTSHVCF